MSAPRDDDGSDEAPTAPLSPAEATPAPAGDGPAALVPGDVVAGRYSIVGLLARGGMGEVYEVDDLDLGERVALKTLRPDIARGPGAQERFKAEIHLARKVTHANVSRIFDLGHDRSRPGGGIAFLTMELLPGESLAARLRRGPLGADEARQLARQVAAGLAAAHRAGVVHRDLKPGNVLLVPDGSGTRAVVTDFGLALDSRDSGERTQPMAGTPGYMSPEQLAGRPATAASDVYALGRVLLQMHGAAGPPPAEAAVIARCLHPDPAARYADGGQVLGALDPAPPGRPGNRPALLTAAAALVAVLGAAFMARAPRPAPASPSPGVVGRRSVAVLGFRNLSDRPESAWISTALAEMVGSELAQGGGLRLVPGENVARMKTDLRLAETDSLAEDTLVRVRRHLGAEWVVLGSYLALNGRLRLQLRIQESSSAEPLPPVILDGTEAEMVDLVGRAGAQVRTLLGQPDPGLPAPLAPNSFPADPRAARFYAEGLARLRVFDAQAARVHLERAAALERGSPQVHSALAEAWSVLGHDARAAEAAARAAALAAGLAPEARLSIEARRHEAGRQWDQAIADYGSLWSSFPDDGEYALRLARVQTAGGRGRDALQTLTALRGLPGADADPRVELAEAAAAESLSEFARAAAAAARAAEKSRALGARVLLAHARLEEGRALWRQGQPQPAERSLLEARRIFSELGDRTGVARTLHLQSNMMSELGQLGAARQTLEQALTLHTRTGHRSGAALALNSLGFLALLQGDLAEAGRRFQAALGLAREVGDKQQQARCLNNLADVVRRQGALDQARRLSEQSLALRREVGDRLGAGNCLRDIADVARRRGRLDEARAGYQESLALLRGVGDKTYSGWTLQGLAEVLLAQDDLAGARALLEEALREQSQLGQKGWMAHTRIRLALLALAEGRAAEAETQARAAAEELAQEKRPLDEAAALAPLALALLAQGRSTPAQEAAARAVALTAKTGDVDVRLAAALAQARVWAAAGRATEARRAAESVRGQARRFELLGRELEARMALALAATVPGAPAAVERLRQLQQDARARGYLLLARQAGEALD